MKNKLETLKKLSASGTFQGGFATLTTSQLLKLKGGSGSGSANNCAATCNDCGGGSPSSNNCMGAVCNNC